MCTAVFADNQDSHGEQNWQDLYLGFTHWLGQSHQNNFCKEKDAQPMTVHQTNTFLSGRKNIFMISYQSKYLSYNLTKRVPGASLLCLKVVKIMFLLQFTVVNYGSELSLMIALSELLMLNLLSCHNLHLAKQKLSSLNTIKFDTKHYDSIMSVCCKV